MIMKKDMMKDDVEQDKKVVKKAIGMHDTQLHGGKKTNLTKLKGGGMATKKMAMGGMGDMGDKKSMPMSKLAPSKPMGKSMAKPMVGMAKGGVTRADGCVSKGHTKGKMIAMFGGGKA
jgi:hypothetical protein